MCGKNIPIIYVIVQCTSSKISAGIRIRRFRDQDYIVYTKPGSPLLVDINLIRFYFFGATVLLSYFNEDQLKSSILKRKKTNEYVCYIRLWKTKSNIIGNRFSE